MSVDPLKSSPASQADTTRLGAGQSARRTEGGASASAEQSGVVAGDRVQLSAGSRTLVEREGDVDSVPEGTISPERMREVLRRLESAYYDSAEVRDTVAVRVRQDLALSATE